MKDKKVLAVRLLLLVCCGCVALFCIHKISEKYDPLARYPYATDENRSIILSHLDEEGINYIITQQIKPNQFLAFIDQPGFSIYNTIYYTEAKNVQNESDEYIVNFINKYRSHFTLNSLKTILSNYSYADLTSFYENEQVLHANVNLVPNPQNMYLVLDADKTVYKYVPEGLSEKDGVLLKAELLKDLETMLSDYKKLKNGEDALQIAHGYESYDVILDAYYTNSARLGDYINEYMFSGGENEMQLGYSLEFAPSQIWNDTVIEQKLYLNQEYSVLEDVLSDNEKDQLAWLRNNGWRYGFIVRYPEGKEELTGHWYQPFLVRYVGRNYAKAMHDQNKVMEEMNFKEEN